MLRIEAEDRRRIWWARPKSVHSWPRWRAPGARLRRISKTSVHRLLHTFCLKPHRTRSFKLSNDPFFVRKLRDVVGLYLNPPQNATVLSVNEKGQV